VDWSLYREICLVTAAADGRLALHTSILCIETSFEYLRCNER